MMIANVSLCSAFLGFFLIVPLLAIRRRRDSNLWLATFVFSVSWLSLADYCAVSKTYLQYPALMGVFDWPAALLGASYYLYVRGLTGARSGIRQLWHIVPTLLWVGRLLYVRLSTDSAAMLLRLSQPGPPDAQPFFLALQLSVAAYAIASLWRIKRYRDSLPEGGLPQSVRDMRWLKWLTWAMCALLVLWLGGDFMGPAWVMVSYLVQVIFLYTLGWYGLRNASTFVVAEKSAAPIVVSNAIPLSEDTAQDSAPKYMRSGMTDSIKKRIGERLTHRMNAERDYLDAELKLTDLAGHIGTSPQLLSQYLNEVEGMSFFEYLNRARVLHVQALIMAKTHDDCTLFDLALQAGFNSKSAFNTSFKKVSGVTPSEWKKIYAPKDAPIGKDDRSHSKHQADAMFR